MNFIRYNLPEATLCYIKIKENADNPMDIDMLYMYVGEENRGNSIRTYCYSEGREVSINYSDIELLRIFPFQFRDLITDSDRGIEFFISEIDITPKIKRGKRGTRLISETSRRKNFRLINKGSGELEVVSIDNVLKNYKHI